MDCDCFSHSHSRPLSPNAIILPPPNRHRFSSSLLSFHQPISILSTIFLSLSMGGYRQCISNIALLGRCVCSMISKLVVFLYSHSFPIFLFYISRQPYDDLGFTPSIIVDTILVKRHHPGYLYTIYPYPSTRPTDSTWGYLFAHIYSHPPCINECKDYKYFNIPTFNDSYFGEDI